jgi:CheY-like chemotaxis protein
VLRVEVADTGAGISPEEQERIFEPYVQGSGNSNGKGTGLGMTIVKSLVEAMGGGLSLESAPGRGTSVAFSLPLEHSPCGEDAGKAVPGVDARDLRVLVVEDNPVDRTFLTGILRSYGYRVESAENGARALEKLSETDFDVLFMDVQMPEMDGIEATREIRKRCGNGLPVIALTGHSGDEERRRFLEAGMNGHLVKPVEGPSLLRALALLGPKT